MWLKQALPVYLLWKTKCIIRIMSNCGRLKKAINCSKKIDFSKYSHFKSIKTPPTASKSLKMPKMIEISASLSEMPTLQAASTFFISKLSTEKSKESWHVLYGLCELRFWWKTLAFLLLLFLFHDKQNERTNEKLIRDQESLFSLKIKVPTSVFLSRCQFEE